ncbi:MAG: hypothetical protein FWF49_02945 [Oscillospiraceae bacterium]|nr:hypothetical protein [Oscillospiraceae bacterium]
MLAWVFVGLSVAAIVAVPLLCRFTHWSGLWKYVLKAALAVWLIELAVFQFSSFHLLFSPAKPTMLPLDQAQITGLTPAADGWDTATPGSKVTVNLKNMDMPTGTLTFYLTMSPQTESVTVDVEFSDDSNASTLRQGQRTFTLLRGVNATQTIPCDFSGNTRALRIFITLPAGGAIALHGMAANRPVPFDFSPWRLLLMAGVAAGLYALIKARRTQVPVKKGRVGMKLAAFGITMVCMVAAFSVTAAQQGLTAKSLKRDFTMTTGNQLTKDLVDAFAAGQVSLLTKPDPALLALPNPYDWSQRGNLGSWDHLLFNGKYYSYYGIAPVVLLFLPYHLLTGYYFPSAWAVLLFSVIGMWFLTKAYLSLIRQKFPRLPCAWAAAGLIILQVCTGIFFCIGRPYFYEIAISAGFMFATAGAYFLLSSRILRGGRTARRTVYWRVMLSGVLLSLAVLSRATYVAVCLAALVFLWFGFRKERKMRAPHKKTFVLAALLPYILFGGVQMLYNFMRFGSPLDFGIAYSLTINDFTNAQFHPSFLLTTLYNYFIAPPNLTPQFPYAASMFQRVAINGFYYADAAGVSLISLGLLFKALPVFGYATLGRAPIPRRDKWLLVITCIAAPLIMLFPTWQSGYAVRYNADFCWLTVMGALVILFTWLPRWRSRAAAKAVIAVSALVALWLCSAQFLEFFNSASGTIKQIINGNTYTIGGFIDRIAYTFQIFR